ncbi:uncharacterized protein LOC102501097 isoform X1 [Tupaia chinensis]|uniref:uncharacterized protein LOC102501097 isoform X1 n=1 Tax=Tupaia chinensis TaxID=246437 RepID=UPI000FFC2711|nr:uncharacterized protein LOC102501097 isoform X1 [Tupaia chinensis]
MTLPLTLQLCSRMTRSPFVTQAAQSHPQTHGRRARQVGSMKGNAKLRPARGRRVKPVMESRGGQGPALGVLRGATGCQPAPPHGLPPTGWAEPLHLRPSHGRPDFRASQAPRPHPHLEKEPRLPSLKAAAAWGGLGCIENRPGMFRGKVLKIWFSAPADFTATSRDQSPSKRDPHCKYLGSHEHNRGWGGGAEARGPGAACLFPGLHIVGGEATRFGCGQGSPWDHGNGDGGRDRKVPPPQGGSLRGLHLLSTRPFQPEEDTADSDPSQPVDQTKLHTGGQRLAPLGS